MNYKKTENSKLRSSKKILSPKSKINSNKKTENKEIFTYQPELVTKNVVLESGAVVSIVSYLELLLTS